MRVATGLAPPSRLTLVPPDCAADERPRVPTKCQAERRPGGCRGAETGRRRRRRPAGRAGGRQPASSQESAVAAAQAAEAYNGARCQLSRPAETASGGADADTAAARADVERQRIGVRRLGRRRRTRTHRGSARLNAVLGADGIEGVIERASMRCRASRARSGEATTSSARRTRWPTSPSDRGRAGRGRPGRAQAEAARPRDAAAQRGGRRAQRDAGAIAAEKAA